MANFVGLKPPFSREVLQVPDAVSTDPVFCPAGVGKPFDSFSGDRVRVRPWRPVAAGPCRCVETGPGVADDAGPHVMPGLPGLLNKFKMKGVTTEVQWSELQRDPKGVAALADQGDVRVRRRDGVPLLLVREDSADAAAVGALSAARALRNALAHLSPDEAVVVLVEEFPWLDLLPPVDRRRFATEFVRAVAASAELGRWAVLAQVIIEWRSTAAVHADPVLVEELTRPLDEDLGPVPAPEGV